MDKQEQKGRMERWEPGERWGRLGIRGPRVARGSGGTKAQMVLQALLADPELLESEAWRGGLERLYLPEKAPRGNRARLVWWEPGERREAGGGLGSEELQGVWDSEARKGLQGCRGCLGGSVWMGHQGFLGCRACRALQGTRE